MQNLTVIEVTDEGLIAVDESGERYRIDLDDSVRARLRRLRVDSGEANRVSPREVQAHIRSGLSAAEVAEMTGASLEYIERFEGPVLAEREHIVSTALAVRVKEDSEEEDGSATFGGVLRSRLASLGASGERWAAWREESGWIVKLEFTVDEIDHDARWSFDTRTHVLDPVNAEAITLSQQGDIRDGLIPRLRAVSPTPVVDTTRFDSGAFVLEDERLEDAPEARPHVSVSNSIPISAIKRAEEAADDQNHTADLLDALRRRRGEREAMPGPAEELEPRREADAQLLELPFDDLDRGAERTPEPVLTEHREPAQAEKPRRGRASIPSWDEIVFGARGDDDQA